MASSSDPRLDSDLETVSIKVKFLLGEAARSTKATTLYEASSHLIKAGGKMVRPYLVVKSCEAVGGDGDGEVLKVAAAVELLHTFTLVHDDIIDNDPLRRGVPAVHSRWNVPIAILAGDFLFAEVFRILADERQDKTVTDENRVRIMDLLAEAAVVLCEGQIMDISFPSLTGVSEEDYFVMIRKKTAWLFKAAGEAGALAGGAKESYVKCLGKFAEFSGIAFQIVDDVLGLEGEEETLGKPIGSDLREGKKTLPVIYALSRGSESQRKKIFDATSKTVGQNEIKEAIELVRSLEGIDYSKKKASKYLENALVQLEGLPNTKARNTLASLANFLVERKF